MAQNDASFARQPAMGASDEPASPDPSNKSVRELRDMFGNRISKAREAAPAPAVGHRAGQPPLPSGESGDRDSEVQTPLTGKMFARWKSRSVAQTSSSSTGSSSPPGASSPGSSQSSPAQGPGTPAATASRPTSQRTARAPTAAEAQDDVQQVRPRSHCSRTPARYPAGVPLGVALSVAVAQDDVQQVRPHPHPLFCIGIRLVYFWGEGSECQGIGWLAAQVSTGTHRPARLRQACCALYCLFCFWCSREVGSEGRKRCQGSPTEPFSFLMAQSTRECGVPYLRETRRLLCLCDWLVQLRGRVRSLEEELEQSHYELASLKARHNEKMSQFKALEEANLQFEQKNKSLQVGTALVARVSNHSTVVSSGSWRRVTRNLSPV